MNDASEQGHRILIVDDLERIHDDFRKILVSSVEHSEAGQKLMAEAAAVLGTTIEDEEDTHDGDVESSMRFRVDSALQGQIALNMVNAALEAGDPYVVAFVDMRMPPGWDGLYTIEKLWAAQPELQVVICTAYSDYSWSEISQRVGQRDNLLVLKKPFDSIEVHQMATALAKKHAEQISALARQAELESELSSSAAQLAALEERLRSQSVSMSAASSSMHRAAHRIAAQLEDAPSNPGSPVEFRRLQGHLDDLVDYLRISAGEDVLDCREFEVESFVQRVASSLASDFLSDSQPDRIVTFAACSRVPRIMLGDPKRIERIIRAVAEDVLLRSSGLDAAVHLECHGSQRGELAIVIRGTSSGPLSEQRDANGMGLVELLAVLMRGHCDFSDDETRVELCLPIAA